MTLSDPRADAPVTAHHHPGRDTEILAATLVRPRAGKLRARALDAIAAAPDGLTDHELAAATETYLYTIAPRRVELMREGWITDSGERRVTGHGRKAVVWTLSAAGRHALGRAVA